MLARAGPARVGGLRHLRLSDDCFRPQRETCRERAARTERVARGPPDTIRWRPFVKTYIYIYIYIYTYSY